MSEDADSPSWKRIGEFLKNVMRLERSVSQLEQENTALRQQVSDLQRVVDDHNGQLKTIIATLNATVANRIDSAAERAAVDAVVRLLSTSPNSDKN